MLKYYIYYICIVFGIIIMLKEKKRDDIAQWNIIYFSFLHVKIFQGFENHF